MSELKIKNFFLVTSFFFSLMFHLIFFNLFVKKNSEEEIFVLELGQYQEYYRPEIIMKKNSITKNNEEAEIIPEKKKIVSKQKVVDEEQIKSLIVKKPNLPDQKKTVIEKTNKESYILEKESEKQILNEKIIKEKSESNFDKDFFLEKKSSNIATKNFIINEKLGVYLKKISLEINRIAHKSYPQQAIRRREEGTINSIITLDKKGELYNLEFENHRPKRLKKATEMIIKNFNFPAPPEVVLNDQGFLKIKIPVNFILR